MFGWMLNNSKFLYQFNSEAIGYDSEIRYEREHNTRNAVSFNSIFRYFFFANRKVTKRHSDKEVNGE